jgi:hypothetical protein
MDKSKQTTHVHHGVEFEIAHTEMGWIATIDGAVPGGRTTKAKAVAMAHAYIDQGCTFCPKTEKS